MASQRPSAYSFPFFLPLFHRKSSSSPLFFCRFSFLKNHGERDRKKKNRNRLLFYVILPKINHLTFSQLYYNIWHPHIYINRSGASLLFFLLLAGKRPVAFFSTLKTNRISICQHQSDVSVLISQPRPILLYKKNKGSKKKKKILSLNWFFFSLFLLHNAIIIICYDITTGGGWCAPTAV